MSNTMRIKSEDPKSQGPFVIIDKADFDKNIHTEFKGKGKVEEAEPEVDSPVFSSKAVEKLAAQLINDGGLSAEAFTELKGTGKGDKITKADLEAAVEDAPGEYDGASDEDDDFED